MKIKEKDSIPKIIVAFDIESRVEKEGNFENNFTAVLIANIVCDKCYNHESNKKNTINCDFCGFHKTVCVGDNCVKEFNDYIFNDIAKRAETAKGRVYVFEHNFKGYDGHFITQDIYNRDFKIA